MAEWIKRRTKLHMLMGLIKDQFSTGIVIAKHGHLTEIDLAVLRATSHEEQAIEEEAVRSVLEIGTGSRMRVSHCICVIMDRLNKTSSWVVALKCLIIIHRCLHEGGFMFRDQLSVHPAKGGHNYLNLSKFKDTSSAFTWVVSTWVRWYARLIEQWIQMARNMRSFLDLKMDYTSAHAEKILSLENRLLVKDINMLHDFLHEASAWQADEFVMSHVLVKEGLRLVIQMTLSVYQEMKFRLYEIQKRVATLERSEALSLLHVCEKLSTESMIFTHLFELVKDWPLQHDHVALEGIICTDYELMNLKQAFRLAASNNSTPSPEQLKFNGYLALTWRSSSWNNSSKASEETTGHMSMSGFTTLI